MDVLAHRQHPIERLCIKARFFRCLSRGGAKYRLERTLTSQRRVTEKLSLALNKDRNTVLYLFTVILYSSSEHIFLMYRYVFV